VFVMASINVCIMHRETRNENQRINCYIAFFCRRLESNLLRKVQHLPKMMFHMQHQATDPWEGS